MRQVFISYSSKDYAQAQAVRNVLEQNGISCWMAPESIPGGSNYTKEIPIAIRGCQAFVLMLSGNAQNSHWVLKELDSAVNAGKIILPFQLEDVPLSDEFNFLLTGAQRYDAYQRKAEAMSLLVSRIKAIIKTGGETDEGYPEEPAEPKPQPQNPVNLGETFGDLFGGAGRNAAPQNQKHPEKHKNFCIQSNRICPACGSPYVVEFPNQVKPREAVEHILMAVLSIAGLMVLPCAVMFGLMVMGTILDMVIKDPDVMEFFGVLAVIALIPSNIFGYKLGKKLAQTHIQRQRIRKHIKVTECRCNTCQKKFQEVENIK